MPVTITRTYEKFAIKWADGSRWSGYTSEAEAAVVLGPGGRSRTGRAGTVERSTFDVSFAEADAHLYNPGIAETRSAS